MGFFPGVKALPPRLAGVGRWGSHRSMLSPHSVPNLSIRPLVEQVRKEEEMEMTQTMNVYSAIVTLH